MRDAALRILFAFRDNPYTRSDRHFNVTFLEEDRFNYMISTTVSKGLGKYPALYPIRSEPYRENSHLLVDGTSYISMCA